MIKAIRGIESQLVEAAQVLRERLKTLDTERNEVATELERVDACLGALKGRKPRKSKLKKNLGPDAKSCPTKIEVVEIASELLKDNSQSMPKDDLVAMIKDRLRNGGKSLSGFGLRFREACREVLKVDENGIVTIA